MENCRRTGRNGCCAQSVQAQTEVSDAVQTEEAEDMPIHRYVSEIPELLGSRECCQLRELNQILDYQNKILVEILNALQVLGGSVT